MEHTSKDRSYQIRRQVREGESVRLLEAYGEIPAGAVVTVWTWSNAGFRGIEATVLVSGRAVHGVPAGILERS